MIHATLVAEYPSYSEKLFYLFTDHSIALLHAAFGTEVAQNAGYIRESTIEPAQPTWL